MTLADILNATFNLYRDNFRLFAGIAAVVLVPEAIVVAAIFSGTAPIFLVIGEMVSLAGSVVVTGALAQAVSMRSPGRPLRVTDAYRAMGWETVLALLGVAFLSALLVFIGFVLFVIPGIYAGVRLVVAAPAAVLEKRGPQAALRRSRDLVAGNWWRVFGIIAVVTLLALGLELILGHLVGSFTGSSVGLGLSTAVVDILVQPIQSIALTLLYFDLVGRSGGVVSHSPEASSRDSA